MRKTRLDSEALLEPARQAPPVGRALRILLGLALILYIAPIYFRVSAALAVNSLLLMVGLLAVYSLMYIIASRRFVRLGACMGAIVATTLLVALYAAGCSKLPFVGRGAGQLAAATFLGLSLVVAGVRATPGCELMAMPGLFSRKQVALACLIFSPVDSLERKLRGKQ